MTADLVTFVLKNGKDKKCQPWPLDVNIYLCMLIYKKTLCYKLSDVSNNATLIQSCRHRKKTGLSTANLLKFYNRTSRVKIMGVDPTTDTTDSVRTSSWACSYIIRVKQPVADRIVRTSFRSVPTRMVKIIINPSTGFLLKTLPCSLISVVGSYTWSL